MDNKIQMPTRYWDLPFGIKTLLVNGYEMAYEERGQGTAVVLVHGSLNDHRAWASQIEPLSARYRTFAVCLRHCYPEPWNGEDSDFSVHQHADDLAALIKSLEIGPVHLVAHSRGGCVALILAKQYAGLVRTLVLADPAPFDQMLSQTAAAKAEAGKRQAFVAAALDKLMQGDLDGGLEIFIDAVNGAGNWKKLPEVAKQIRRDNAWSLKSLVEDAKEPFSREDARKIEVPVLLVTGDNSPRLYGLMHAALQPCLRRSRMATVLNASHGMNRENPVAFNAAVLEFLAYADRQQHWG